jgi:alpha-L-fucosidase
MFKSADLKQWDQQVVIQQEPGEHLFNSSVCAGPDGFVMAYESNDPAYPAFTTKFATSKDLATWTKLDGVAFGKDRYTACPCIRYADGFYYVLYTEHRTPRWFFETWIARSTDLKTWALSPMNPVLRATEIDDGIDASDPDLTEINGQTSLYYAVGDQLTWMNIKRAQYAQPLDKFLAAWFAGGDGIPAK